jgi:hypothetical protein
MGCTKKSKKIKIGVLTPPDRTFSVGTSQHHDTKREQCLHKSWLASQSKRQQRLRCLLLSSCIGKMSKTNHELGDLDFSFCSRYDWRGLTTTGMEVLIDRTMHTYLSG